MGIQCALYAHKINKIFEIFKNTLYAHKRRFQYKNVDITPKFPPAALQKLIFFWRLTIYSYFAIIETLFFITLRRYCSSGRCFQVRICQFRSHYMPIKKQNFRKFSETHYMPITLYAHKGLYEKIEFVDFLYGHIFFT